MNILSYFGLNFIKIITTETQYINSAFVGCKIFETPVEKTVSISNNGCSLSEPLRKIQDASRTKRFSLGERNSHPSPSPIKQTKIIELAQAKKWLQCDFEDTLEERNWSNYLVKEMVEKGNTAHFLELKDEKTQYFLDVNIRVLIPIIAIAAIVYSIFKSK